jgi:ribosome-binding protein aMBF1 (putative translation factor)
MAKYSTNNNDNSKPDKDADDASCELCGKSGDLTKGKLSGAVLLMCRECSEKSIDESKKIQEETNKNTRDESNNVPKTGHLSRNPDSTWVKQDRADYGNMNDPYMKPNYTDKIEKVLTDKNITVSELYNNIDVKKSDLNSIVNGSVVQDDVSIEDVSKVEEYLNTNLQET